MNTEMNRVAIVTGGSRGIGREMALDLARAGFNIAIGYGGDQQAADEAVEAIQTIGVKALAIQGDVANPDAVIQLFDTVENTFGRIDVVISNAGIIEMANIEVDNLAIFDRTMATNTRGTYLVMAEAARRLSEGGRIIALSTSVIAKSIPGYGAYIASKAAVEGLVRVLANEVRGKGITVNAVAPGPVETELFLAGKPQEVIDGLAIASPFERLGQPADIARITTFLAGVESGWIHGQVLRVNGGFA